jgi:hypothetical protein
MFSKRAIGTDLQLKLHDRTYTAMEVATTLLKYFKECAERALGRPVRRAVVTHPAYFDPNQVQETRLAAIAAGFDMSLPEQMMMEPAAAALAYTMGIEEDPLTVMTYDLGGGTFDVTVLQRSQGVITMKAFDGDHLLGGYNFDRMLVDWIMDRLSEKGRVIPFNEANPEDLSRYARLLQLAESVKIKLSEQRNSKVLVDIRAPDILLDADGHKVQILERINREQYAELIKEYLDKTIECCNSALGKAGIGIDELDAILLVGGSTYGQWVVDRVRQEFGKDVEPYNPDRCVAAGAAIRAGTLPAVASSGGLDLVLDVASTSALPEINISGTLSLTEGTQRAEQALQGLRLLLTTPSWGTIEPHVMHADGRFLFEDIALLEDEPSPFTLQISDSRGVPLLEKPFQVTYAPEQAESTQISTVLPKPIYLKTADGMKAIAEEGVPLPARCSVTGQTLWDDTSFNVNVYQENEQIATIEVDDLPPEAGNRVLIEVEITQQNEMKGTITITSRTNAVLAQRPIRIMFPPLRLPELAELRATFLDLEDQRQQLEVLSQDPEQRLLLGGKGLKLSKKLSKKFEELVPDRQEILVALKEFTALVHPPPDDMTPPRIQFRNLIDYCMNLLASLGSEPSVPPLQQMLKRIETEGNDAFTTKNHRKWTATYESLEKLYARIQKLAGGGQGESPAEELPPTPVLKEQARQRVDQTRIRVNAKREELKSSARYESNYKNRLNKMDNALDQVLIAIDKIDDNTNPKQALAQIQVALISIPKEKTIDNVADEMKLATS